MIFNKQQLKAINTPTNEDVLISAVAGSGKTQTLTEKVYKVIKEDGLSPDNILVLTFTDNAAFNMKRKIIGRFNQDKEVQEKIASAHIQTFDSFNSYLIKKYSNLLNIDSNFKIIKNEILETKKREYLDEILNYYYNNERNRILKTLVKFELQTDNNFKNIILDLYKELSNLPYDEYNKYLKDYEKYYDKNYYLKIVDKYIELIKKDISNQLKANLLIDKHEDNYEKYNFDYIKSINFESINKNFAYYSIEDENLKPVINALDAEGDHFFLALKAIDYKKSGIDVKKYQKYEDIDTEYKKITSFIDDAKLILEIVDKLIKKIDDYKNQYFQYEFTDLQKKVINLLQNNTLVRKELQEQYKFIMIDEYQDTNVIQEKFIDLLTLKDSHVFLVGDAKQAIYGFRNSDVKLFNKRSNLIENNGKKITLNYNYRSSVEIMNDINYIFKSYMTKDNGEINYLDINEQLQYDKEQDNYGLHKEFGIRRIVSNSRINNDGIADHDFEVLAIINDIINKMNSNFQVYDQINHKYRPVKYSDFMILTRTTTYFSLFNDYFNKYNIPLNIKLKQSLSDLDALTVIESLIDILASIENKEDNLLAFSSLARSYIYRISDQELFEYFENNNYKKSFIYQDVLNFYNDNKDNDFQLMFFNLLNHFEIIEKLNAVGSVKNTIDKIESLYQILLEYAKNGFNYPKLAELYKSFNKHDIELVDENVINLGDAVNLMTIHASKGLESKIVYMPVTMNNIMTIRKKPNYIFTKEFGLLFNYNHLDRTKDIYIKTLYEDYYNIIHGDDDLHEHARILYVALTRAEDLIYFVGDYKANKENPYVMLDTKPHYPVLDEEFVLHFMNLNVFKDIDYQNYKKVLEHIKSLNLNPKNDFEKIVYKLHQQKVEKILNYIIAFCFVKPLAMYYKDKNIEEYINEVELFSLMNYGCDFEEIEDLNKHLKKYDFDEVEYSDIDLFKPLSKIYEEIGKIKKESDSAYDKIMKFDKYVYALNKIDHNLDHYKYISYQTSDFKDECFVFNFNDFDKGYKKNGNSYNLLEQEIDYNFEFKEKIKQRASKIEDNNEINQDILDLGVKLHRYLELTDLKTKDTSFIKDIKDKEIIDNVLKNELFSDLDNAKIYKEYGYYDNLLNTTGFIDLFYIRNGEYYIIDYKTKHIDDDAYQNQLNTYKRNILELFPESEGHIHMYLLSIIDNVTKEIN